MPPDDRVTGGSMVVPPGYMDIGNPVKKPKVSAYTSIPREWKMLPFSELFNGHKLDYLITIREQPGFGLFNYPTFRVTCFISEIFGTIRL